MLKLNVQEEKKLYNDWNGSTYGRSEFADPENDQMDCLNTLEEKLHQYPIIEEQWQEKLLKSSELLGEAKRKMNIFYGFAGTMAFFSILLMIVVVGLKLNSTYVMFATVGILLMMTAAMISLYFGIEATCFYGVHNEWQIFQKYIQKYQVVSLKLEIQELIEGIQFMKEECQRAERDREQLKKGVWLSEEEYRWASTRPEAPELLVHTENLAKNLWKKNIEDD